MSDTPGSLSTKVVSRRNKFSYPRVKGLNPRCHYCQMRDKRANHLLCSQYPKCKINFCFPCLKKRFKMDPDVAASAFKLCLVCMKQCSCEKCKSKKFLKASKTNSEGHTNTRKGKYKSDEDKLRKRKNQPRKKEEDDSVYLPSFHKLKTPNYAIKSIPDKRSSMNLRRSNIKCNIYGKEKSRKQAGNELEERLSSAQPKILNPAASLPPDLDNSARYLNDQQNLEPILPASMTQQYLSYDALTINSNPLCNLQTGPPLYQGLSYPMYLSMMNQGKTMGNLLMDSYMRQTMMGPGMNQQSIVPNFANESSWHYAKY